MMFHSLTQLQRECVDRMLKSRTSELRHRRLRKSVRRFYATEAGKLGFSNATDRGFIADTWLQVLDTWRLERDAE